MGHSWARRLELYELNGSLVPNLGLDPGGHSITYIHAVNGQNLYTVDDFDLNNIYSIKELIGKKAHLVIIILGTNDIASHPMDVAMKVNSLYNIGGIVTTNQGARMVSFVEVFPRFGPQGFLLLNTDFLPIPGVNTWNDCNITFRGYMNQWNTDLYSRCLLDEHMFYIPMRGTHINEQQWLMDGLHLNLQGEIKFQHTLKRYAINLGHSRRQLSWAN